MKINSNYPRLAIITFYLLVSLFLLPSLALSEESYKSLLEKARNLDKDEFFEDAVEYWQKILDANPPPDIILYAKLKDRKSTRLNSSHVVISYAVFCLKKKN